MPETIKGLGHVLAEWRYDDGNSTIDQWAVRLASVPWSHKPDIITLLTQADKYDYWVFDFICDCFDEFLDAMRQAIYRDPDDQQRWIVLYDLFTPARKRLLGLQGIAANHP